MTAIAPAPSFATPSKYGGNLGAQGSVSYLFHTVGLMTFRPARMKAG
jgi:transcriptional/translational regulatory protein YebC/TACO1